MDNPLKNSPATDKEILKRVLDKLKGNQVLVFLFYLFAIVLLGILFYIEVTNSEGISIQTTIILIVLILCMTLMITLSFIHRDSPPPEKDREKKAKTSKPKPRNVNLCPLCENTLKTRRTIDGKTLINYCPECNYKEQLSRFRLKKP